MPASFHSAYLPSVTSPGVGTLHAISVFASPGADMPHAFSVFTSPLAGEVDDAERSSASSGGESSIRLAIILFAPPSPALPRKGGGSTHECAERCTRASAARLAHRFVSSPQ